MKFKSLKAHPEFDKELSNIQAERIKEGIDKMDERVSKTRITLGLTRAPEWVQLKRRLITSDMPKEKNIFADKGGSLSFAFKAFGMLILVGALSLAIVLLMAIFSYGWNTLTVNLVNLPTASSNITNVSYYAGITFGNFNIGFSQFQWLSALMIMGLIGGVFLSAFLVKLHPMYFGVYIIFSSLALYISILISRAYESLLNSGGTLGAQLQSYGSASWLVLYLPYILAFVAIIGAVFLFTQIDTGGETP